MPSNLEQQVADYIYNQSEFMEFIRGEVPPEPPGAQSPRAAARPPRGRRAAAARPFFESFRNSPRTV